MNCINCNALISSNSAYRICTKCKFDTNVMISETEAKRRFKLTRQELRNGNLFFIQFTINGNIGTKYLISEVRNLANRIVNKLDTDDRYKMAFQKYEEREKEKIGQYMPIKYDIIQDIILLLQKYDTAVRNYATKLVINKFVDLNHNNSCYLSKTTLCLKICDDIWNHYRKRVILDDMVKKQYGYNNLIFISQTPL